jgi:hypothetical protein
MLNCSALSAVLSTLMLVVGLIYPAPLTSLTNGILWGVEIILFWVLSFFFYRLSIDRAKAWGNTVKAAFDLYRWDLLKQLGYSRLPQTAAEEKDLWFNISQRMSYGDTPLVPPPEYSPRTTFLEVRPDFIVPELEVLRGIEMPEESGELIISVSIKNISEKYNARKIVLIDTLPDDFRYRWDTATLDNPSDPEHKVSVAGINPYRFNVGKLEKGKTLVLTYRGLSIKKEAVAKKGKATEPAGSGLKVNINVLKSDSTE